MPRLHIKVHIDGVTTEHKMNRKDKICIATMEIAAARIRDPEK